MFFTLEFSKGLKGFSQNVFNFKNYVSNCYI